MKDARFTSYLKMILVTLLSNTKRIFSYDAYICLFKIIGVKKNQKGAAFLVFFTSLVNHDYLESNFSDL